ncbi:Phenylalanine--tRNA ligase beta subunit [Hondaea fermentalgiana]|uniref:Phenylalanine--tRNA ligase beta subunit n=1 Tax=Hondaea fermentalgiana TaxID=2315210 RepID=A0A2R5G2S6_9STRA|nr:Phenylalanine--tRNA ligase beta subunit [Hondaea fermentalgiana]|eukprot:GBG25310.1 Phenylalanine--tRNA ligase beta subunit [Hondaea fermentalgiana]
MSESKDASKPAAKEEETAAAKAGEAQDAGSTTEGAGEDAGEDEEKTLKARCEACDEEREVEKVEEDGNTVFCLECGEEFELVDPEAAKYAGYIVGKVLSVEPVPKKDLKKVQVDLGKEEPVQVVTNAKHVSEGSLVIVATIGAIVPAGAKVGEDPNAVEVKKSSVGGVPSFGMLCDSDMLQWVGGAKGVVQTLEESDFSIGDRPPSCRPRK